MSARRPNLALLIPPPLLFVASFFLASALQRLVPIRQRPSSVTTAFDLFAWIFLAAGFALIFTSLGLFARARTTLNPAGQARALVSSGAYRFTRNPMYVGLSLAYVGFSLRFGAVFAVPMLAFPLVFLNAFVIPFEEQRMHEAFGQAYTDYCIRVRRWV